VDGDAREDLKNGWDKKIILNDTHSMMIYGVNRALNGADGLCHGWLCSGTQLENADVVVKIVVFAAHSRIALSMYCIMSRRI
jgi:hypothetical protein